MKFRTLGRSGLKVSVLGLGTNAFGSRANPETSARIIHAALDSGINFLDTANIYSGTASETIIGEALQSRRHEAVIGTKAGIRRGTGANDAGSSRIHLQTELEGSLRRLRTDYVDLYQIHTFDESTPLEETLFTLDGFVRAGKVRYIGASNYAAWQLMKALAISDTHHLARYISIQPSYSLADRTPEPELIPLCLDQGVGLIPYFPLAGGILTGKYASADVAPEGSRLATQPGFANKFTPERLELGRHVADLAKQREVEPGALALAWLAERPTVATIIVGATSPAQLASNLQALALTLDADTMKTLDDLSRTFRYGPSF